MHLSPVPPHFGKVIQTYYVSDQQPRPQTLLSAITQAIQTENNSSTKQPVGIVYGTNPRNNYQNAYIVVDNEDGQRTLDIAEQKNYPRLVLTSHLKEADYASPQAILNSFSTTA